VSAAALQQVAVVLWEPQNYINIAGTIRAMKNFGLFRLRLISPAAWDPWRIEGIAHDTAEIIAATEIHATLASALADCSFVAGLTARERRAKRAVDRPRTLAAELVARAAEAEQTGAGPIALLFGREDRGLSNEALDFCHRTVTIPTNPEHPSLNLAQAVLLMGYELWMAVAGGAQPFRDPRHAAPQASVEQLELLFADAERALWAVDFFKSRQTESVMRTVRELVRRAEPDAREAAFVRAMAIEVVKFLQRQGVAGAATPASNRSPPEDEPSDPAQS
jgi:TrmH family RNA methyltransferase